MIRLISFEGGDGSGKSTQLKLLESYLTAQGKVCLPTREPGGTNLGNQIRPALLQAGTERISSLAELFLYVADRAQHVREVIRPAIETGRIVLCDRFIDSTVAYQGYGRGIDLETVRSLNQLASQGIRPDVTLLLDCPVTVGLSRAKKRVRANRRSDAGALDGSPEGQDRFEQEKEEFHERVRRGFLELARAEPDRICVMNASGSIREIQEEIQRIVNQKLSGN